MLELLAASGNYIAILVLCASCWVAGRSVGNSAQSEGSSQGWTTKPLFDAGEYALLHAVRGAPDGTSREPARDISEVQAQTVDCDARRLSTAEHIHDLILHGDLSQDGVIESLVAMAEDQIRHDAAAHSDWKLPDASQKVASPFDSPCPEARILTRSGMVREPLPADLADPLTTEVLSRYRMYAQECNLKPAE
ncbi:hypothetical protein [Altererythrobacter sp. GH1-8]|uniref:hypothetical protein n=1 Tax=Altererythrobacter sp. GH1-8 TaxID=3349333 RepID=UPI00374D943B